MNISNSDRSTLVLALSCWIERCKSEAEIMEGFAVTMPKSAAKCRANAAASRNFADDARALLDRM